MKQSKIFLILPIVFLFLQSMGVVHAANSSSPDASVTTIFSQINHFRNSKGLLSNQSNNVTCLFAQTRAIEIVNDFSHFGFQNRIATRALPYTSYLLVVENISMNPDFHTVVSHWINSPGHVANMLADTVFGCVGHTGNYYVYEGYKP